jgi:hypothetical protein
VSEFDAEKTEVLVAGVGQGRGRGGDGGAVVVPNGRLLLVVVAVPDRDYSLVGWWVCGLS